MMDDAILQAIAALGSFGSSRVEPDLDTPSTLDEYARAVAACERALDERNAALESWGVALRKEADVYVEAIRNAPNHLSGHTADGGHRNTRAILRTADARGRLDDATEAFGRAERVRMRTFARLPRPTPD